MDEGVKTEVGGKVEWEKEEVEEGEEEEEIGRRQCDEMILSVQNLL